MVKNGIEWAAGLFEGEGSITCGYIPQRKDSIRVQLTLSSSDKDVLELFVKAVNCGRVLGPYPGQQKGNKDRYNWHIQNQRDCLYVLGQLYPYLGDRRRTRADEMFELIFTRNSWKALTG